MGKKVRTTSGKERGTLKDTGGDSGFDAAVPFMLLDGPAVHVGDEVEVVRYEGRTARVRKKS